jgi:adenylate cyclase class 2
MPIETEIKLKIENLDHLLDLIRSLNATLAKPRHLEDNTLFDYPEGTLKYKGSALRIRVSDQGTYLTFKGPSKIDSTLKVREELETPVENGATVAAILDKLGLVPIFRYQKYRTEYAVDVELPSLPAPASNGRVLLMIDETPIGNYLELEGSEGVVKAVAGKLGFAESDFIKSTYITLYRGYCEINDLPFGDMVFK